LRARILSRVSKGWAEGIVSRRAQGINLTQEGSASLQYKYDGENRMVSFNNGTASYTYVDAARVKKVSGSTTTVYVFSGSKVIAEYVNSSLSKEYVYSGGTLLATSAGSTTTYNQPDPDLHRGESAQSTSVAYPKNT
jgi:hypothetical protein